MTMFCKDQLTPTVKRLYGFSLNFSVSLECCNDSRQRTTMQQVRLLNNLSCRAVLAMMATLLHLAAPSAKASGIVTADLALLQQMQKTIQQQQQQLELQAEQIRQQSENLKAMQQQVTGLQQAAPTPKPAEVTVTATPPPQPLSSGNDRIRLAISGQINRAVNIVSDGSATKIYHVDNNVSNSRIRFVGSAQITDDLLLGTRIEVGISPDNSSRVSQTNQAPGDYFNQRWAEISLQSKKLGKLSLGKGDTASKGTASQDLSRTDGVQFVGISTIAGGLLFRETGEGHELTTIKVRDVFRSRDGLGRQSRLRYDTPNLFGFTLAGSVVSGQRSDLALYWGGEGYGFKAVGAAAVANPRLSDSGLQYDGSFSLLHTASGLNLTVAGGILQHTVAKDNTNLYAKLGWIANFTNLGYTAFGVDYTNSGNMPTTDDRGYSVGAAVVQAFEKYATELYLQYRVYSLKQGSGVALDYMRVSTLGVRVKF
jgi:predicted porin